MHRFIYILLLFFCVQANANKQFHDTTFIDVRKPPEEKLAEYKNNNAYNYSEEEPSYNSLGSKLRMYISDFLDFLFNNGVFSQILQLVLFGLLIAGIVYILAKNQINSLFINKSQPVNIKIDEFEEDMSTKNIDELIKDEIKNKNYRRAVRLYYIKTLKLLNSKELINWEQNKTNRDYYYDLAGSGIEANYQQLTWVYENIWYGNFPVGEGYFYQTDKQFNAFFKVVENNE